MTPVLKNNVKHCRQLADVRGEEPPDLHLGLWDVFSQTCTNYPEREAVVSLWQLDSPESGSSRQSNESERTTSPLRWTYSSLKTKTEQLAKYLTGRGCRPGMRIAATLWNSAEWALFFWTSAKLRITFVPLDPTADVEETKSIISSLKPQIIAVQDEPTAITFDSSYIDTESCVIRMQCSRQDVAGWIRLCDVMLSNGVRKTMPPVCATREKHNIGINGNTSKSVALVVLTSGTTGNPKYCQHTDRNLLSQSCDFDPEPDPSVIHRWLVHTPTFHIFAINNALRAWKTAGVVVFPSKSFNIDSTLEALVQEGCSIMSANPTLVRALISHQSFPAKDHLKLHLVTLGGTDIDPETFRLCRESLGVDHAIQVYGMSECGPLITWKRSDSLLAHGHRSGVGKILPGGAARVCQPGGHKTLRRTEVGELHISGPSVIEGYLSSADNHVFYKDGNETWLVTGDQASIDEQGIVHILGRYKDLIIRGGENISPARIESKLNELSGLQAQVVGLSDTMAGQVPVAIVKLPSQMTKADVFQQASDMGPKYVLDAVYTLVELKLPKFPITSTGKVKKEELRCAVMRYREHNQGIENKDMTEQLHPSKPALVTLVDQLVDVWQQLTGFRPSKDDSIMYLADSITLLRYCEKVLRTCGKRLYLQDFIENDTLAKHADLLNSRARRQAKFDAASQGFLGNGQLENAKSLSSVPSSMPNEIIRRETQRFSEETRHFWKLAQQAAFGLGLGGVEVADILEIRESLHRTVIGQRPQSFQNRMVFCIRGVKENRIRKGLERALTLQPLMRSIVFLPIGQTPCHVVLSPHQSLFSRLIHEVDVATEEEAMELGKDESLRLHSTPFMFQGDLVKVGQGNVFYLVMTFSHSIIDAMSLSHWYRELDELIIDPNKEIAPLTPYKLFNDLFSHYESSIFAQESVQYHIQKLRGISRFRNALWPPQHAPGWMVSSDEGSPYAKERGEARKRVWKGEWESRAAEFQYPRCCRAVWLPGLARLRETHGVHPSLLTKCGLIIFNILQTGSSQAIFTVWESGRSWPFVPQWMESLLPPSMSIDGPTVQWVLNMTKVVRDETVAEFFRRITVEQQQDRRHEHVPWGQVVQGLRDEGQVAVDASYRQSFVWDVSLGISASRTSGIDFTKLEPKARYGWADNGIYWNAFSIDKDNIYFIASWDTAQINDVEMDGYCDCLAEVIRKLADEKNWERKIGEVFGR